MTTPANKSPLGGGRPLGASPLHGGLRGPSLAPLAPGARTGRSRAWLMWLLLVLLVLAGVTYLLGRTVEPVRERLEALPAIGKPLFGQPVWPVLWNKPAAPAGAEKSTTSKGSGAPAQPVPATGSNSAAAAELQELSDEAAARLAAAEAKENDLKQREADLKAREQDAARLQAELSQSLKQAEDLKKQLEAQLRTEQDRVEVFRAMGRTAQTQFLTAVTDDEVLAMLKYMTADEVGKVLERMDPYRAARLWARLPKVEPPADS